MITVEEFLKLERQPQKTYYEHVNILSTVYGVSPVLKYAVPGEPATYCHVPEKFRDLVRGVVNLILDIHEVDHVLKPAILTLENLWYTRNDELVMCGVDPEHVAPADRDERFKRDWLQIADLLRRHMFLGYMGSISRDLISLIDNMLSYKGCDDEKLIKDHLALMKSIKRMSLVEHYTEKIPSLISRGFDQEYTRALGFMGNFVGWKANLITKPLNPIFKEVRDYYYGGRPDSYYDDAADRIKTNKHLLRCARNITTCLNQGPYGRDDIDNMIMATFGKPLIAFHKGLGMTNLLKRIL